jgi:hypothetical protein
MKLLFLTAAAVIALPAAAQTTTSDQTTTDQTMTDPTPAQDPPGGYMPPAPPLSGPVTPGTDVIFKASAPPSQAFPAPPPMDEYPICKPGQFDDCRQRGG